MKSFFSDFIELLIISILSPFYFMRGLIALHRLHQPIITFFGGMRAQENNGYAKIAYQLAYTLGSHNYSIITGGGPGMMHAANAGAADAHKCAPHWTLGFTVKGVDDDYVNNCAKNIQARYFFIRKWLLMRYSAQFVFLPGGIGTAEELFELLDLKKHGMVKTPPVILMDRAFWQPLLDWYEQKSMREGFITMQPKEAYVTCDSAEEAFAIILHHTI